MRNFTGPLTFLFTAGLGALGGAAAALLLAPEMLVPFWLFLAVLSGGSFYRQRQVRRANEARRLPWLEAAPVSVRRRSPTR